MPSINNQVARGRSGSEDSGWKVGNPYGLRFWNYYDGVREAKLTGV